MTTTDPVKPSKPTRAQREFLTLIGAGTVRRFVAERWSGRDTTHTFYWAVTQEDGKPGPELSERIMTTLAKKGWAESVYPKMLPIHGVRDLIAWQTMGTLVLTPAGRGILG